MKKSFAKFEKLSKPKLNYKQSYSYNFEKHQSQRGNILTKINDRAKLLPIIKRDILGNKKGPPFGSPFKPSYYQFLVFLVFLHRIDKIIEQVIRIGGTARGFRVELGGEERFRLMLHPLVGVVIQVNEVRFPIFSQRVIVDCKAMILGSDVRFRGSNL